MTKPLFPLRFLYSSPNTEENYAGNIWRWQSAEGGRAMETRTVFYAANETEASNYSLQKVHPPSSISRCSMRGSGTMEHWSVGHITNHRIHPYQATKFAFSSFAFLKAISWNRFAHAENEIDGTCECCKNFVIKCCVVECKPWFEQYNLEWRGVTE